MFPKDHFLESKLKLKNNPIIVAYSSFDGFIRIIDINNKIPIFSLKIEFGGINTITLSEDKKKLCLSC